MAKQKSGSRAKRRPKLRGDAARAARMTSVAKEAAASALRAESQRRTLLRVIAALAERAGGEVRLPFQEVSGAPPLGMVIEGGDTPDAVMVLAVGDREEQADLDVKVEDASSVAEHFGVSPRVDAQKPESVPPVQDGLEGASRDELLRQLRHLRVVMLRLARQLGEERFEELGGSLDLPSSSAGPRE